MNARSATKLSMHDLVAVREGGTIAEALAIARHRQFGDGGAGWLHCRYHQPHPGRAE